VSREPSQYEVIVACSMFGDILVDSGAGLEGGLGMAASGNVHPGGPAMFEPVHGSSPSMAGKNIANPFGAILTASLMCEHLGLNEEAKLMEQAVISAIKSNQTTSDIGGLLGTREVGKAVCDFIRKPSK